MYLGETSVNQNLIERFLKVARELDLEEFKDDDGNTENDAVAKYREETVNEVTSDIKENIFIFKEGVENVSPDSNIAIQERDNKEQEDNNDDDQVDQNESFDTKCKNQGMFEFMPGRTKTNPGILIVDKCYQMTSRTVTKDKLTFYYFCQHSQTMGIKCPAKATVKLYESPSTGEMVPIVWRLDEPVHQVHKCLPNKPQMIANQIRADMKKKILENPLLSVGEVQRLVKFQYFDKYSTDEIWPLVLSALGSDTATGKTLYRQRAK